MNRRAFLLGVSAAAITVATPVPRYRYSGSVTGRMSSNRPNYWDVVPKTPEGTKLLEYMRRWNAEVFDMRLARVPRPATVLVSDIAGAHEKTHGLARYDYAEIERRIALRSPELLVALDHENHKEGKK